MSIKPIFARQIYNKVKGYELRRKLFPLVKGDRIILYETSPVKSITGEFIAGEVKELEPEEVLSLIRKGVLQGCDDLDVPYVVGRRKVLVIEVKCPKLFKHQLSLSHLRRLVKGFRPPRSYMVVKNEKLIKVIEMWSREYG